MPLLLKLCSMKISRSISEKYGHGAPEPEYDEAALEGMKAKSDEFAAKGNRVYLPLAE
jgi:phosphomethylpyrimidine synthase